MPPAIKKIILFSLSLCGFASQAQTIYFDKIYDSGLSSNQNEGIWSNNCIELNDGYLFTAFTLNNQTNVSGLWILRTDIEGDTLWSKSHIDTAYQEFSQNIIKTSDNNYVITSTPTKIYSANPSQQGNACLTKIDSIGEIIWKKQYGADSLREVSQYVILTNDNGFALTGQKSVIPGSDADVYLVKTDSLGDMLWEKQYGGSNFEAGQSLVQTPDTGYLILGWTRSFGSGQRDFYLVKTDSEGNQQWQRTYGSGVEDVGWGIVNLFDGNFLLSGGGGNNARIIKVDIQGNVIWQNNYVFPTGTGANYLYWPKELPDYSIVGVGLTNNSAESDAGWLIKIDSAGNELWQRNYNYNSLPDLFYTVLPTSDAGFLLGGQAINSQTFNQDAWLLKVDSLGCPYPNCVVGTSIDENNNTKVVADIWPNPANEVLNIEFQNEDDWQITLTDVNGKVVFETTDHGRLTTVNTSIFSNGVYLLQLVSGGSVVNKKIVVSH